MNVNVLLDFVSDMYARLVKLEQIRDSWRWGAVIGVSPIQVRLDGDSSALPVAPDSLVPLAIGDRVRVQLHNKRLSIVGKQSKLTFPVLGNHQEHDVTFIAGVPYVSSGSVLVPTFTWGYEAPPIYSATLNMPIPYVPPTGWTFAWSVQESAGFTFAQNGDRFPTGGTHRVRVTQFLSASTTTLKRLQWQLVRA